MSCVANALHFLRVLTSWLLLLSVDATTVPSSPLDSPASVLIIGQQGLTDLTECSGTLIATQWVLTARSCLYHNATRITRFLVYAGGSSYQEYAERKLPPSAQLLSSYRSFVNTKYDLALLKTQGAFRPDEYVRIIPLERNPIRENDQDHRRLGSTCSVTGFGSLITAAPVNGTYRITDKKMTVISPCDRPKSCSYDYYVWQKQKYDYACSYNKKKGAYLECAAMPGAGLICYKELHGVAHTIVNTNSKNPCIYEPIDTNPCGNEYTSSVFTLISPHLRWIDETMFPDQFPHPFPGCNAFGQAVERGGRSPLPYLLFIAVLLRYFIDG